MRSSEMKTKQRLLQQLSMTAQSNEQLLSFTVEHKLIDNSFAASSMLMYINQNVIIMKTVFEVFFHLNILKIQSYILKLF